MCSPTPIEDRRHPDRRKLEIRCSDGHRSDYPYDELRGYCPCASCQGHAPAELVFHPPQHPVEPLDIRPVGNYALTFRWSDGHATGIYRFDLLRALCPCPACRPAGGPDPKELPTR
ncbi:MAG: DUF971 domain-containing protein [Thermoanaerobaculia bacterium]|nr:DUF971 domain-containing protein [Thermoanaerobaculia bacterium]